MSLRPLCICLMLACASAACGNSISTVTPTTPSTPAVTDLTGRIVDAVTSAPLASAMLTLVDTSGNVLTATTGATGAFDFPNLATGTYSLQVTAPGYLVSIATLSFPVSSYTVQMSKIGSAPVSTLSVNVTGQTVLPLGGTSQLSATVTYTDGTTKDITNVARWASSVPSVATISSTGLVTAYTIGQTAITATFQDLSGGVTVATTSP